MSRYFPKMDRHISTPARAEIAVTEHVIADAPRALDGLTALFASDIHLRRSMDPARIVSVMNACGPDLILLGGDYADTRDEALRLFDAFRGLHAPLGIYAVRGNNDAEAFSDTDSLARALNAFGARLLVNESAAVAYHGVRLLIGGVDEYQYGRPDYCRAFPENSQADYRILLSHYPILPEADAPDMMLSGHTHGGQFNALGLTPYAIGFERFGRKRFPPVLVSGAAKIGPTTAIVSKGVGISRIPLRIGVQPEIHLLKFQKISSI